MSQEWIKENVKKPIRRPDLDRLRKDMFKPIKTATLEKEINKHITLRLEYGKTYIYVNKKRFIQCIRLILNIPKADVPLYEEIPFYSKQKRITLRNCGIIDPESIEEYIARGGYEALAKVLDGMKPAEVVEEGSDGMVFVGED